MRRYLVWLASAAVALLVYVGTNAAGLPGLLVLLLTFIGAIAGALAGTYFTQRLRSAESAEAPRPPRDRGSGRTKA